MMSCSMVSFCLLALFLQFHIPLPRCIAKRDSKWDRGAHPWNYIWGSYGKERQNTPEDHHHPLNQFQWWCLNDVSYFMWRGGIQKTRNGQAVRRQSWWGEKEWKRDELDSKWYNSIAILFLSHKRKQRRHVRESEHKSRQCVFMYVHGTARLSKDYRAFLPPKSIAMDKTTSIVLLERIL